MPSGLAVPNIRPWRRRDSDLIGQYFRHPAATAPGLNVGQELIINAHLSTHPTGALGEHAVITRICDRDYYLNLRRPDDTPVVLFGNCDLDRVTLVHPETDWIVVDVAPHGRDALTTALVIDTTTRVPRGHSLRSHCMPMPFELLRHHMERSTGCHPPALGLCTMAPPAPRVAPTTSSASDSLHLSSRADAARHRQPGRQIPPGLVNSGTSCYMNSVLVCLAHLPSTVEESPSRASTTVLGRLLRQTLTSLRHVQDRPVHAGSLHQEATRHFAFRGQEDAASFLRALLGDLDKLLGAAASWPWHGGQVWMWRDPHLQPSPVTVMPVQVLDLPGSPATVLSIQDLLDDYFAWSTVAGLGGPTRRPRLTTLPACLAANLIQGTYQAQTGRVGKNPRRIRLTSAVCLNHYLQECNRVRGPWRDRVGLYLLRGLVIHCGPSLDSGHYYCFQMVRNQWYVFNDAHVRATTWGELEAIARGDQPSHCPTLLFYARADYVTLDPARLGGPAPASECAPDLPRPAKRRLVFSTGPDDTIGTPSSGERGLASPSGSGLPAAHLPPPSSPLPRATARPPKTVLARRAWRQRHIAAQKTARQDRRHLAGAPDRDGTGAAEDTGSGAGNHPDANTLALGAASYAGDASLGLPEGATFRPGGRGTCPHPTAPASAGAAVPFGHDRGDSANAPLRADATGTQGGARGADTWGLSRLRGGPSPRASADGPGGAGGAGQRGSSNVRAGGAGGDAPPGRTAGDGDVPMPDDDGHVTTDYPLPKHTRWKARKNALRDGHHVGPPPGDVDVDLLDPGDDGAMVRDLASAGAALDPAPDSGLGELALLAPPSSASNAGTAYPAGLGGNAPRDGAHTSGHTQRPLGALGSAGLGHGGDRGRPEDQDGSVRQGDRIGAGGGSAAVPRVIAGATITRTSKTRRQSKGGRRQRAATLS